MCVSITMLNFILCHREELMAASEVKPMQLPFVHNQKEAFLSFTVYLPSRVSCKSCVDTCSSNTVTIL